MVRVLIALRRTIVRHQLARTNPAVLLAGAGVVFISALGTIWLGLVRYPDPAAATDVLALIFALWLGGRVAQSALAGDAVLRPEVFGLLPLERRRLAFSLLAVGLLDPAGLFTAVAFAALIARGARLGLFRLLSVSRPSSCRLRWPACCPRSPEPCLALAHGAGTILARL